MLQRITVSGTSPKAGEIIVSADFVDSALPDNATATGFIAIAYNSQEHRYGKTKRESGQRHAKANISDLLHSNYKVSVFPLQHNGLPFNKAAATATDILNIRPSTGKDFNKE